MMISNCSDGFSEVQSGSIGLIQTVTPKFMSLLNDSFKGSVLMSHLFENGFALFESKESFVSDLDYIVHTIVSYCLQYEMGREHFKLTLDVSICNYPDLTLRSSNPEAVRHSKWLSFVVNKYLAQMITCLLKNYPRRTPSQHHNLRPDLLPSLLQM